MALTRKVIATDVYEGRCIEARHMGPDLLAFVDDMELGNFYVDTKAVFEACRRHVDAELKSEREAVTDKARADTAAKKVKGKRK